MYKNRFCLLCFLVFCLNALYAQPVVFWTENFNNGCTSLCLASSYTGPNGSWSIVNTGANGAQANTWYVSCAENGNAPGTCGSGCGNDATLHVGNVPGSPAGLCPSGDCGAAYDASTAAILTDKRVVSPVINATGYTALSITFHYIGYGEPGADYVEVEYSTDNGVSWSVIPGGSGITSQCCCLLPGFCGGSNQVACTNLFAGQGYWQSITLNLPSDADNQPDLRIGFRWRNNANNTGKDPSFAVDDIQLSGTAGSNFQISSVIIHHVKCFGGSDGAIDIEVTGAQGVPVYQWSNGATTQDISGLAAGNYSVTVFDGGSAATGSFTVNQPQDMSITKNVQPELCIAPNSGSIDLTVNGGTPPYRYQWSNGATTQDVSGLSSGYYYVTITDDSGCVKFDTTYVPPEVVPSGHPDTCRWTGIANTDWFEPCNWDKLAVPDTSCNVLIPGGTPYQPLIAGDTAWCKHLIIIEDSSAHLIKDVTSGGELIIKP